MEVAFLGFINIAIDGPAGAGKSTVAKLVSKILQVTHLDTGAMYRAIAYKALQMGIDLDDATAVSSMLRSTTLQIQYVDSDQRIILNDVDITNKLRTPNVSKSSSIIAQLEDVRFFLVQKQREIAKNQDVVMDGRDIGSYVLPEAKLKIFLTASVEARAYRRLNEFSQSGQTADYTQVKNDIESRDWTDKNRTFSPLIKAENAIEVDTSELNVDEVVQKIIRMAREIKW